MDAPTAPPPPPSQAVLAAEDLLVPTLEAAAGACGHARLLRAEGDLSAPHYLLAHLVDAWRAGLANHEAIRAGEHVGRWAAGVRLTGPFHLGGGRWHPSAVAASLWVLKQLLAAAECAADLWGAVARLADRLPSDEWPDQLLAVWPLTWCRPQPGRGEDARVFKRWPSIGLPREVLDLADEVLSRWEASPARSLSYTVALSGIRMPRRVVPEVQWECARILCDQPWGGGGTPPDGPRRRTPLKAAKDRERADWIYRERMRGLNYLVISLRLKKVASPCGWTAVGEERCRQIAHEYAAAMGLPPPDKAPGG
jgi:hypothetical protein